MDSVPGESDAWRRIERFKGNLAAQLFLQQGSFWEAVRDTRSRLGITPTVGVPPPEYRAEPIKHNDEALRLYEQIPEMHRRWVSFDWLGFVDMCIDFDPPRDSLEEFAACCGGPFLGTLLEPLRLARPTLLHPALTRTATPPRNSSRTGLTRLLA